MKNFLTAASFGLIAMTVSPAAIAGDDAFSLSPQACEETIAYFLEDRLYNSNSARIQLDSDPYRVMVELTSGQVEAWAIDAAVKSRLPNGSWSNYQRITVIFQDGVAVALKSDVQNLTAI